jgi:hypothetical protein
MQRIPPVLGLLEMPHREIEVAVDSRGSVVKVSPRIVIPCGCSSVVLALPLVLLVKWLWPTMIPFDLFAFWNIHGNFGNFVGDIWPLLVGTVAIILFWRFSSVTEEQRWNFYDHWVLEDGFFLKTLRYFIFYSILEELVFPRCLHLKKNCLCIKISVDIEILK